MISHLGKYDDILVKRLLCSPVLSNPLWLFISGCVWIQYAVPSRNAPEAKTLTLGSLACSFTCSILWRRLWCASDPAALAVAAVGRGSERIAARGPLLYPAAADAPESPPSAAENAQILETPPSAPPVTSAANTDSPAHQTEHLQPLIFPTILSHLRLSARTLSE